MALADPKEFWPEREAIGEAEVRRKLIVGAYGDSKLLAVQAWLQSKESARAAEATERDQD